MAYKEVNFKSKLIEWTQKNKVCMEYRSIFEGKDENGSPVFECVCVIEGIECCKGKGFSKKEAHQHASEGTLKKLRKQPKFCDSIFAAKTARTKMEEEPVMAAPDIEKEMAEGQQFIIVSTQEATVSGTSKASSLKGTAAQSAATGASDAHFDIDFSDIQTEAKEPTREDIIAAAEAAAFK